MKIAVKTEDLKKAMGVVERGVSLRPQLPILSGVLLGVKDGGAYLMSTDLELSFYTALASSVEEEGSVVVPAKLFAELTSSLPKGVVDITVKDNKMEVRAGGVKAELVGQVADDFPIIPRANKSQMLISASDYRRKVDRVCASAAKDDSRVVLNGVLWELAESKVRLAATDGYRLSVDEIKLSKCEMEKEMRIIMPAKTMQEVGRLLGELGVETLAAEFNKKDQQVIFNIGGVEVTSRLIGGEFPPYQQIMPNTYQTRVVFDRLEVLEAVKRANLFARESANIVKLEVQDGSVRVMAESSQIGNSETLVESENEGEKVLVAFNARYLTDFFSQSGSSKVFWETEGELKPSVFRGEEETSWVQVVMPVRVQG